MVDAVLGAVGGAAASLVASFVFAFDDSVPFPVSLVLARLLGIDATDHYRLGFLGTFAYGVPAGFAYVALFSRVPGLSLTSLVGALVAATVWAGVLTGLFVALVGDQREAGYDRYLLASHLLYGLVLAGLVALGPTDPTSTTGPAGGF